MFSKLATAFTAALVLTAGLSAAAFAQADIATPANPDAPRLAYVDADNDGTCDNFVDADGDGVCDNAQQVQRGPQAGNGLGGPQGGPQGAAQGAAAQHQVGDGSGADCPTGGVPPQDGSGQQMRRGRS